MMYEILLSIPGWVLDTIVICYLIVAIVVFADGMSSAAPGNRIILFFPCLLMGILWAFFSGLVLIENAFSTHIGGNGSDSDSTKGSNGSDRRHRNTSESDENDPKNL
jgi:hypothetical protein